MSQKLKEVKLTPNTSEHDMSYRVDNIKKWFEKGDKVKITLTMKGREQSHSDLALSTFQTFLIKVAVKLDFVTESTPRRNGRNIICIIRPRGKNEK